MPTEQQLASSVLLYGRQPGGILQATGVVVDADRGWVVTAWHFWSMVEMPGALMPIREQGKLELAPTTYLNHYFQGRAATPRLVWFDSTSDLALLEIPKLTSAKSISLSRSILAENDALQALGNPSARNAMWQIEPGQAKNRQWVEWTYPSGQRVGASLFEFRVSESLTTGYSGGPVFNDKGEVAGIIIAAVNPDGLSVYAVESGAVQRFLGRAHGHLALKMAADGQRTTAKRHANLAVALDSAGPWGYLVRARVEQSRGRTKDAVEDLQTAVRAVPLVRCLNSWSQALETIRKSAAGLNRDELRRPFGQLTGELE